MNPGKILILAFFMLFTSVSQGLLAKVPGITTGSQLQAEAEKRTQTISTKDLEKLLDEQLGACPRTRIETKISEIL